MIKNVLQNFSIGIFIAIYYNHHGFQSGLIKWVEQNSSPVESEPETYGTRNQQSSIYQKDDAA